MKYHGGLLSIVENELVGDIKKDAGQNETCRIVGDTQDLTCYHRSQIHIEYEAEICKWKPQGLIVRVGQIRRKGLAINHRSQTIPASPDLASTERHRTTPRQPICFAIVPYNA